MPKTNFILDDFKGVFFSYSLSIFEILLLKYSLPRNQTQVHREKWHNDTAKHMKNRETLEEILQNIIHKKVLQNELKMVSYK